MAVALEALLLSEGTTLRQTFGAEAALMQRPVMLAPSHQVKPSSAYYARDGTHKDGRTAADTFTPEAVAKESRHESARMKKRILDVDEGVRNGPISTVRKGTSTEAWIEWRSYHARVRSMAGNRERFGLNEGHAEYCSPGVAGDGSEVGGWDGASRTEEMGDDSINVG
ncbi:hypothetical protein DFH06DRAFT_1143745 [Mycena polygramma]|nr:hypothetical protein DFH06DRAFT_1143745 [Mycena polygramma]